MIRTLEGEGLLYWRISYPRRNKFYVDLRIKKEKNFWKTAKGTLILRMLILRLKGLDRTFPVGVLILYKEYMKILKLKRSWFR